MLLDNQVKDAAGNFIPAKTLGTINVHVPFTGDTNGDER